MSFFAASNSSFGRKPKIIRVEILSSALFPHKTTSYQGCRWTQRKSCNSLPIVIFPNGSYYFFAIEEEKLYLHRCTRKCYAKRGYVSSGVETTRNVLGIYTPTVIIMDFSTSLRVRQCVLVCSARSNKKLSIDLSARWRVWISKIDCPPFFCS